MSTHPSKEQLLQAVITYLQQPPGEPYLALVARNALGIVLRELQLGPAADARAAERLRPLLGMQADLPALEAALAAGLRNGSIDPQHPGVLQHLRLHTLDRLAIDQPRYKHALTA
jgi:hypothetical protein